MVSTARHTSAHTSAMDGVAFRDSRKARRPRHPRRHRCPHHSQGTSVIKQQKERAFSFSGKLARSNNSLDFTRRFGSGSRSRFVTTAIDGYRKSPRFPLLYVRVGRYRQMIIWLVSNPNNRRTELRRASRLRATNWSSASCRASLFLLSGSLPFEFSLPHSPLSSHESANGHI